VELAPLAFPDQLERLAIPASEGLECKERPAFPVPRDLRALLVPLVDPDFREHQAFLGRRAYQVTFFLNMQ